MAPSSVLLVDDNATFLRIATRFLEVHGQDEVVVIGKARDGMEALAQAQELQPQVILLDLVMPDLSGLEVIPRLRAMLPDVGIIALTVMGNKYYRTAALAAGADDLVSKGAMSTELLPAIRRVIHAREQPDPA
jgi:CheY-like chemotaxis protein